MAAEVIVGHPGRPPMSHAQSQALPINPQRFPSFNHPVAPNGANWFVQGARVMELFCPLSTFVAGAKGFCHMHPDQLNITEHTRRLFEIFAYVCQDFNTRASSADSSSRAAVSAMYERVPNVRSETIGFRLRLILSDGENTCAGKVIKGLMDEQQNKMRRELVKPARNSHRYQPSVAKMTLEQYRAACQFYLPELDRRVPCDLSDPTNMWHPYKVFSLPNSMNKALQLCPEVDPALCRAHALPAPR